MLQMIDTQQLLWGHSALPATQGDGPQGTEAFADLHRRYRAAPQQAPASAPPDAARVGGRDTNPLAGLDMSNAAHRELAYEIVRESGYSVAEAAGMLGVRESDVENWLQQNHKSLPAGNPVPDLSNDAWLGRPHQTRAALDTYVHNVINGSGSWAEKYETLKETLPPDYFVVGRTSWLNRALETNNAQAADNLIRAIDPYSNDRWIDAATNDGMNSLAAGAFSDAVRVGYDLSGQIYDLDTAKDVAPGEYRDISNDWAQRIIAGNAPVTYPGDSPAEPEDGPVDPGTLLPRSNGNAAAAGETLVAAAGGPAQDLAGVKAYVLNRLDLDGLARAGLNRLSAALDDYV